MDRRETRARGDEFQIRPYEPGDLEAVYEICLLTGDSGRDASDLYDDPMALGHLYAAPYVTLEPELAFVLEVVPGATGHTLFPRATNGVMWRGRGDPPLSLLVGTYVEKCPAKKHPQPKRVCGYVLGALDTVAFHEAFVSRWLPELQKQVPDPQGEPEEWTPTERVYHRLHHPQLSVPDELELYPSHLHIDLLPHAQGRGQGRRLMETFLEALRRKGSPGVHLGVGERNVRAQGFYRRLGFRELGRGPGSIYMGMRL